MLIKSIKLQVASNICINQIFITKMKNIIYLWLILIGFTACQNKKNQNIILSGNIKNAPDNQMVLMDIHNKNLHIIRLDSTKHFTDTLKIGKGYYKLNIGNQYTWLYLKPGDRLQLTTNYKDFDNQLTYKGKGSDVNNYLAKKILLEQKLKPKTSYNYYGKLDEKTFVKLQDSIAKAYNDLLKSVKDKEFKNLESLRNKLEQAQLISRYPMVKRFLTNNPNYQVPADFPKAYANIDINDTLIKKLPQAIGYINDYVEHKLSGRGKEVDPIEKLRFAAKNIKDQNFLDKFAYKEADYNLLYTKDIDKFYELFNKIEKKSDYKAKIKTKYDNIKAMQPGVPSPDFTAYDINGKAYHLKDFAGKPLYIDLWATWCGPCRAEIPFLEKIKEQYKDKPINFVSFDVYDDKAKWEQMVKQQKMSGWQLINTDKNLPFLKKYVVDGIPRFILIDKDGKIVNADAPRPSDKSLIPLLDKTIAGK